MVDAPASPDAPSSPDKEPPRIGVREVNIPTISAEARFEYLDTDFRGHAFTDFDQLYQRTTLIYDAFVRMSTLGEINAIYRNRPIWINYSEAELVDVAMQVITNIPTAKTAILTYIGLLVHENANMFFSEKENPKFAYNYSSVQNASLSLLGVVRRMIETAPSEQVLIDVLKWCCDLSYELSENNNGRPLTGSCRTPENLLDLFLTCPSIKQMISLMDFTISQLLIHCPDECMNALFYASRHGSHFNWIWLHIADTFPGKVVENIFTIGGEQFKAYVDTIQTKKRAGVAPHILDVIHQEYSVRFMSLSAVFNFLMRRGNIELRNIVSKMISESLETDSREISNWNIVFFFKLVTCSVDTLRYLVTQNAHLATPLNFYRGVRQILSLDQEMIIQRITYREFCLQMIHALDTHSQGVVFKVLARVVFDPNIFAGFEQKNMQFVEEFKEGAKFGLEIFLGIILRMAHQADTLSPMEQNALGTFASGSELQFVTDIALINPNLSNMVIRYLHSVSIAFSELKAAEIASRMLFSARDSQLLHVFCAFLSSVVPFYNDLMQTVYKNIFSFRDLYLSEKPICDDSEDRRACRNISFIAIIRSLLENNLREDSIQFIQSYEYLSFSFNPRGHMGMIVTKLLSMCIETVARELEGNRKINVHTVALEVCKLLRTLAPSAVAQRNGQARSVLLPNRYAFKMSIQLACLLKFALLAVTKDDLQALSVFAELQKAIVIFYSDLCHGMQKWTYHLFLNSFLTQTLLDNEAVFGEGVNLDPWRDTVMEKVRSVEDEDDYSFLDAVEKMDVRQHVNRLAHSGVIGRGARRLNPLKEASDDQLVRCHVFLDAVRSLCITDTPKMTMSNLKVVALFLVEILCQDGVAADMLFQDWEIEKENVAKYQVMQRMESSWLSRGLMEMIAETHPCLWYCLPLIKIQLSITIMKFLSTTDKNSKPTEQLVDLVDQWLILARKGNLIPERFELFIDVFPNATVHEGSLLLRDFWAYFQRRSVTQNTVDHAVVNGSAISLMPDDYEGDYKTCKAVIQRHIIEMGHLFPRIFAKEIEALKS